MYNNIQNKSLNLEQRVVREINMKNKVKMQRENFEKTFRYKCQSLLYTIPYYIKEIVYAIFFLVIIPYTVNKLIIKNNDLGSFLGSYYSGCMALLVLYLTLKNERKNKLQQLELELRKTMPIFEIKEIECETVHKDKLKVNITIKNVSQQPANSIKCSFQNDDDNVLWGFYDKDIIYIEEKGYENIEKIFTYMEMLYFRLEIKYLNSYGYQFKQVFIIEYNRGNVEYKCAIVPKVQFK